MVLNRTDNFCMKNIVSLELYLSWHDFNIKIFSHCRPSVEYIRFKMKWKKIYSIYDSNNDRSIIITLNTKQTSRLETVRQILRRHFTSSCLDSWQIFAWEFLLLSWKKINCRPGSLMTLHLSDWETFFRIAQLVRPLWSNPEKKKKCRLEICRMVSKLNFYFVFKEIMIDLSLLKSKILKNFFEWICRSTQFFCTNFPFLASCDV